MIKNFSHLYLHSILKNPKRMLLIMVMILMGIGSYTANFKLDASADSLILENDIDLLTYKDTVQRYSTKDFIVMTYTPRQGRIFDENHLLLIKRLKEKLLSIKNISSVVSIVDVPLVQSSETSLTEMINNVPTILSKEIDIDKAENEILSSPIYKNLIISSDGTTTAIQINLNNNENLIALADQKRILTNKKIYNNISVEEEVILAEVRQGYLDAKNSHDEDIHKLLKSVRSIQSQFSEKNNVELRLGGIPMIADDMIMYVKNDLINFGLGVFFFIVITLIIIFRKLKWVVLPILSCIYSVLFMIGLLGLLNWQVTVISSNFISLMLILTLSMNIHLIVRYRQLSSSCSNQYDAISMTACQMVRPCLYTALTTIVAFASLIFSDIKPVIDFGYMMTFGLIVTFVTSFTLLPSILLLLKKIETHDHDNSQFWFTKLLANLTINKGKYIMLVTIAILLSTIYGVSQLRVENSFINYFKSNTEIYQGMKQIDEL